MEKLNRKSLDGVHAKGDYIGGLILVRDYDIQLAKNGKEYIVGTLCAERDIKFKAWSNSNAFGQLKGDDLKGKVVIIQGTWDDYNDVLSLILSECQLAQEQNIEDFIPTRYNADAYWNGLINIVKNRVSEKAMNIANKVLFENEEVAKPFKIEFAAKSFHDNCKAGLLAHTYKVCSLVQYTISMYDALCPTQDEKDLLMLGALFHDLGKIKEMHLGVYTQESVVTHRYLGIEMLDRDMIVENYNEMWYYHLVSIMLQHHGEYGDPCRSLVSKIINVVDNMDATLTLCIQKMEEVGDTVDSMKIEGDYLSLYRIKEENS